MRRLRNGSESGEAISFDSLLDAITNLAGVLLVILVLVALGSRRQYHENQLTNVDQLDQVAAAAQRVRQLESEIQEETKRLRSAERKLTDVRVRMTDSGDETRLNLQHLQSKADNLKEETERLRQKFASTQNELLRPFEPPPTAQVVKFRPPKERATTDLSPIRFELAHGRVTWVDVAGMAEDAVSRIQYHVGDSGAAGVIQMYGNRSTPVRFGNGEFGYRIDRFVEHFVASQFRDWVLEITPLKAVRGETVQEAAGRVSTMRRILSKLGTNQKTHFVMFLVQKDSFDSFHIVRDMCISQGWRVGWSPHSEESYVYSTTGMTERPQ